MELFIDGEPAMLDFGGRLARLCDAGCVVFLHGELGAGKTTLVRGFLRQLGHEGAVKSPTYTLVEHYTLHQRPIYHFDLYRLGDAEELEFMGIREYFRTGSVCLVEWAEKGLGYLPKPDLNIRIIYEDAGRRRVHVAAETQAGQHMMRQLHT